MSKNTANAELLNKFVKRALYYSAQMINQANNRPDIEKGDPKVGGHPAACASSVHILGALHLVARKAADYMAVKPHASPMDHAYSHLLGLFSHKDGTPFTDDEAKKIMFRLRAFMDPSDPNHEPAFQSYHAVWDPDSFHYFPTGTVGIPPVVCAYTALAYRFAKQHGFEVPADSHFWSIMGDSEYREGSLAEALPEIAERGLHNVTWIIDYNRQNLDGARLINHQAIEGTDADRIERTARANGWHAIQVRHGSFRESFFKKPGGQALRDVLEHKLTDFEFQALLLSRDGKQVRARLLELNSSLREPLQTLDDKSVYLLLRDVGGHDIDQLIEVFEQCRKSTKPTLVVIHTIKGWNLECEARTGNHSELASDEEIETMRKEQNIPENDLFALFAEGSEEKQFCQTRGAELRRGIQEHRELKDRNLLKMKDSFGDSHKFPESFGVNLKLAPWANTQWMWGQIAAKLVRIANARNLHELNEDEKRWNPVARYLVTMAPDVGTSTNLNPSMDGKIFAPRTIDDYEDRYRVKDSRRPNLVPDEQEPQRHIRFEIVESNCMSCLGAFGKMGDHLGIPLIPMMTVYDFFIKRALDQFFYNLYWSSSFILVGTPSGATLSPEGAQHCWKSDFQIPNCITWEPAFSIEMEWIIADAIRRHFLKDNNRREGVLIRAVTRGIEQKSLMDRLKKQPRFQGLEESAIFETMKNDTLAGAYWLIHYEGSPGYAPGDNVVHIFALGSLVAEAMKASDVLLEQGIYANVAIVTSPDLLLGTLAHESGYAHLRSGLGVNGNLYLRPAQNSQISTLAEFYSMRGSRIPVVAVCDGEPGLLDNLGSIVGTPQETLALRKHSKSGKPSEVYGYHHMDPDSIAKAAIQQLELAASEEILVKSEVLEKASVA